MSKVPPAPMLSHKQQGQPNQKLNPGMLQGCLLMQAEDHWAVHLARLSLLMTSSQLLSTKQLTPSWSSGDINWVTALGQAVADNPHGWGSMTRTYTPGSKEEERRVTESKTQQQSNKEISSARSKPNWVSLSLQTKKTSQKAQALCYSLIQMYYCLTGLTGKYLRA